MSGFAVTPLPTADEVTAGSDLLAVLLRAAQDAGWRFTDGDVVCVASKVVAKAEGRTVPLAAGEDVHTARRRLAREQARRIVADAPFVLVVETQHGFVCANAGIDGSNLAEDGVALLLPTDPDGAAAAIREGLRAATGADVGVVVTDTFGRPWRLGQTDVALGAAGVEVLRDERGTTDRVGRPLEVTLVATGDQVAAAADLARTKSDGTPFVVLRGLEVAGDRPASALLRPSDEDLFRHGGATAVLAALDAAAAPPATGRAPSAEEADRLRAVAVSAPTTTPVEARPTRDGLVLRGHQRALGTASHAVVVAATALGIALEQHWDTDHVELRWAPVTGGGEPPDADAR